MIDSKILRTNIQTVATKLKTRGYLLDIDKFQCLERERRRLQINMESLQLQRRIQSKEADRLKAEGEDISVLLTKKKVLTKSFKDMEKHLKQVKNEITKLMMGIPNLPAEDAPVGQTEADNVEIRRWKSPPKFNFTVRDHVSIGEQLNSMDFQIAAKLTGSRFVVMKGKIAQLHRALVQFMLDSHVERHGYQEVYVPLLVNKESLIGTGQLPKFSEELFHISGSLPLSLIPTAEVAITNFVRNAIISSDKLPLKFVASTPCFRSEAGSYGRDTRGIIRQHQFDKVELVQIVTPENALKALDELTGHAEFILRALQLPYRVLQLCTTNISFSACKTYDLEVWFPSRNIYREISSCTWCSDFQARRMRARFKTKNIKKTMFLHTLNGSALAVGRTLAAVLENYQQQDGSITIPNVLRRYMQGLELIAAM